MATMTTTKPGHLTLFCSFSEILQAPVSSNGRDKKRTESIRGPKIPSEELPAAAAAAERFVSTHKRRTTPSTSLITCVQECLNLGDCTLHQSSFQANEKMNLINSQEKKADKRLPR
jgi:hypothetical protein